ncbi:MAG: hypothetical protein CHACPFDD_02908 [Phycisphaerae bacterium]|nr:hypothetical protein [Phycisphaerae bacterium]
MNRRQALLGALAIAVLGTAVLIALRGQRAVRAESDDFPDGTFWLCAADGCGADFVRSVAELGEFYRQHPGEPLACPKCGKTQTQRALRCPLCKRHYAPSGPGERVVMCPRCGQELPRRTAPSAAP